MVLLLVLVLLPIPGWALQPASTPAPHRTEVTLAQGGAPRVFSGEDVRLSCRVPGSLSTKWSYLWFLNGHPLSCLDEDYVVLSGRPQQSGEYSCQGVRKTPMGDQHTLTSPTLQIHIDGGWVIQEVPPLPMRTGEIMTLTCRVRGNPKLTEAVFYKDGIELLRQSENHLKLHVTMESKGSYWCRATWGGRLRSISAQSLAVQVPVIEMLEEPVLSITDNRDDQSMGRSKHLLLTCATHLHARDPSEVRGHYHFLRDGQSLGPVSSRDSLPVEGAVGRYRCKVSVPKMGLEKWSDVVAFGVPKETLQRLHPTNVLETTPAPTPLI